MAESRYPRLATLADLPRLVSLENVSFQWPPPGTTEQLLGFPETWTVVSGTPTSGDADTWWVTTLAHVTGLDGTALQAAVLARKLAISNPVLAIGTTLGNYPVIYERGLPPIMKWIRSTFRGQLGGGVEEFQFKMDWGNPGNDPNLAENAAGAFAEFLRDQWNAVWISTINSNVVQAQFAASVQWTEIGVTQWSQDAPKNADGSGGDAHQEYPNAWSAYTVGALPVGSAAGNSLPFEVSCAVTLHTSKRGPRGRGRLYLPPFATSKMDPNGVFQAGVVSTVGAAIGDLIEAVQGSTYAYDALVVSMREKVLNTVTSVSVGKVPDSQRRRRRSQDEARVIAWSAV